eukprot:COSAG03_NODE_21539_length_303_cov_0.436275_1_plen_32_part_10
MQPPPPPLTTTHAPTCNLKSWDSDQDGQHFGL